MHVIIGGCGRVGVQLAERLSQEGHDVVVIDLESHNFDRLGSGFHGETVLGDITSQVTLRQASADKADAFVAVTQEDNANLMAVEIAREMFGVTRAVARLFNPDREDSYRKMGVHYVSETRMIAKALLNELHTEQFPPHIDFTDCIDDVQVVEMAVTRDGHGVSVAELEADGSVRVAAIRRKRRVRLPKPNDTVLLGDVVVAAVSGGTQRNLRHLMCDPVDSSAPTVAVR